MGLLRTLPLVLSTTLGLVLTSLGQVFSATFSSLALTANPFDAGTGTTLTATVKDAEDGVMANQAYTLTRTLDAIDISACVVVALDATIPDDGVTEATIRAALVYVSDGAPVVGLQAADISCASSRGVTDTIAEASAETDANGYFYFTVVSSTAGNPVFTVTVRGAALTDTATFEVSGSGFAAPDIYEHDFEGGSNAAASGDFVTGGGAPFIDGTTWVRDGVVFNSGAQSVKQTYPISGGNVGTLFMYNIASPVVKLHTRIAYHQTSPFNDAGSGDNADIVKMIRFYKANLTGAYGSLVIQSGSEYRIGPDGLPGVQTGTSFAPNVNLPAPTPNDLVDGFHSFEFMMDYTTDRAIIARCWIDDVLYFDYVWDCRNEIGGIPMLVGNVQFDGTINSMASVSTNNYDDVALSTERIGAA